MIRVLSPLHHDGRAYGPGDAIDRLLLSDEQLAHLAASGVVEHFGGDDVLSAEEPAPARRRK